MKPILLAAALLATPGLAPLLAQDISGAWTISSSVGTTPITVSCALTQTGKAITGTCKPAGGEDSPAFSSSSSARTPAGAMMCCFAARRVTSDLEADIVSDTAMKGMLTLAAQTSAFTAVKLVCGLPGSRASGAGTQRNWPGADPAKVAFESKSRFLQHGAQVSRLNTERSRTPLGADQSLSAATGRRAAASLRTAS